VKYIRIIYVESLARVTALSLSGRMVLYLADRVLVQWPGLKRKYPRTEYLGILV
jgi:beta-1,4-N-acetylglucosaminyltransferase